MSHLSRDEESKLAAEFEREAENEEHWEEVPPPTQAGHRKTLGTQVTIRLDEELAEQLRQIARQRGLGYTSLLRSWVEERLNAETSTVRASRPQITVAGDSGRWNLFRRSFELSGWARVIGAGG
jgi:predicted DNA binding CopG/RHH family protein